MAVNCEVVSYFRRLEPFEHRRHHELFRRRRRMGQRPYVARQRQSGGCEMTNGFLKDTATFGVKVRKSAHEGNVVFNSRIDSIIDEKRQEGGYPRGRDVRAGRRGQNQGLARLLRPRHLHQAGFIAG